MKERVVRCLCKRTVKVPLCVTYFTTTPADSREGSYIRTLIDAAILYDIADACRENLLPKCPCYTIPPYIRRLSNGTILLNGCGDNLDYATEKTTLFTASSSSNQPGTQSLQDLVHNHNARLAQNVSALLSISPFPFSHFIKYGAELHVVGAVSDHDRVNPLAVMTDAFIVSSPLPQVINNTFIECKCHGFSVACPVKTCVRRMKPFKDSGNSIYTKYLSSVKVRSSTSGGLVSSGPADDPTPDDLVYSEDSPDYCTFNSDLNILGTRGRTCNPNTVGSGSCDLLCCGRGYYSKYKSKAVRKCGIFSVYKNGKILGFENVCSTKYVNAMEHMCR